MAWSIHIDKSLIAFDRVLTLLIFGSIHYVSVVRDVRRLRLVELTFIKLLVFLVFLFATVITLHDSLSI